MKKTLFPVLLIALVVLLVVIDTQRRNAQKELQNLTVRMEQLQGGNSQENKERAKAVVEKVKTHIMIPGDIEPTVATIVDVEALRAQNAFYNKAENGDFLLVTPTRAILYDPNKDLIIDVVPVQVQQPAGSSAAVSSKAKPQ